MPACDSVNDMNRPTANSGMSAADVAAERDEQDAGGQHEHEDPVREHESVATVRELARKEPVGRDDAGEAREVGERGVGRQRQDRRGRRLQEDVEHAVSEHRRGP